MVVKPSTRLRALAKFRLKHKKIFLTLRDQVDVETFDPNCRGFDKISSFVLGRETTKKQTLLFWWTPSSPKFNVIDTKFIDTKFIDTKFNRIQFH